VHWKGIIERAIERKIEEIIDVTGRRGRRCKQILDDLKVTREYYKLKYEAQLVLCGELVREEAAEPP